MNQEQEVSTGQELLDRMVLLVRRSSTALAWAWTATLCQIAVVLIVVISLDAHGRWIMWTICAGFAVVSVAMIFVVRLLQVARRR